MTTPIPTVSDLLANNRAWARGKIATDPSFFKRLVAQQNPAFLWIGCSDSRVPANEIVGLDPGELFVHRNVANLAPPQDANYLSVLQYAVQVLKVSHILVVGHYGCGGVRAALRNQRLGLIDHWLAPVRELMREHVAELAGLDDDIARHDRLCELNVLRQVENVATNPFVLEAWERGENVMVHGWCYSIENGLVTDLQARVTGIEEATGLRRRHRTTPDRMEPLEAEEAGVASVNTEKSGDIANAAIGPIARSADGAEMGPRTKKNKKII
jgi:carbonic anhydrase